MFSLSGADTFAGDGRCPRLLRTDPSTAAELEGVTGWSTEASQVTDFFLAVRGVPRAD